MLARRQPDPFSFLILLFPVLIINMLMSGIRQGAAIGVMCMAFVAFSDRRSLRFAALTGLASLLHARALVFLLLAPLALGRYSQTRLVLSALLAVPGLLLLTSGDAAEEAFARYIGTGVEAFGGALRVSLLVMTAGYFMIFHASNWQRISPRDYSLMHLGSLIMLTLPALLLVSSIMADRLGYYLIPIQAIILARLPWMPVAGYRGLHVAAPYLVLTIFFIGWASFSSLFHLCYLPYSTWLFGVPTPEIGGF